MTALHSVQIDRQHIALLIAAGALAEAALADAFAQRREPGTTQSVTAQHELEAIEIGGMVAAGDHHPGVRIVIMVGGEIEHRRGHQAQVDHIAAAGPQALGHRLGQRRRRQPAVTAQQHPLCALRPRLGAEGAPDQAGAFQGQGVAVAAAHVVAAEHFIGDLLRHVFGQGLGNRNAHNRILSQWLKGHCAIPDR